MLRKNVLIDDVTLDKLDAEVVDDVVSCLWPQDCQTCGWSLGSEPCALVIDEMLVIAHATLHHAKCNAPRWNDSGVHYSSGPVLSWVVSGVIIPTEPGGGPSTNIAGIVLNPSLEMVTLRPGSEGKWELDTLKTFRVMGFKPPRSGIQLGAAVPRSRIVITPTSWRIHIPGGFEIYEVNADPQVNKLARAKQGALVIVTQAADPGRLDLAPMPAVLMSKHTVAGWVPLDQD